MDRKNQGRDIKETGVKQGFRGRFWQRCLKGAEKSVRTGMRQRMGTS